MDASLLYAADKVFTPPRAQVNPHACHQPSAPQSPAIVLSNVPSSLCKACGLKPACACRLSLGRLYLDWEPDNS